MAAGKGIGKPRGRSVSLTTYNGTDTSLSARHSCALCCFATSWSQKADQGVENEGDDGESSRIDSETNGKGRKRERGGGGGGEREYDSLRTQGQCFARWMHRVHSSSFVHAYCAHAIECDRSNNTQTSGFVWRLLAAISLRRKERDDEQRATRCTSLPIYAMHV